MALTTAELQILITAKDGGAGQEIEQLSQKAKSSWGGIETASALATAGLVAFGAAAIKIGIDFEQSMSKVQAVSGATGAEMDKLTAKAKQIGADTAFSSRQAADAMGELAANGITTAQILNGAADAAAALAAAGGTTLPQAADTMSTAMVVWKLSGDEMVDTVNRIASAANVSRFGVEDMSQAISQGGGAAAAAHVDFADFATVIATTAQYFQSGSDAGTSFKTFISSLPGNSKEARKAIEDLGLSFYDASGNLKSMGEIAQELHDKLGPLSDQEQQLALKTIFGNDAARTAIGLMDQTAASFDKVKTTMGDTNAMDQARVRMDNAAGSIEQLKGSLETMAISLTEVTLPAIQAIADKSTSVVNAFTDMGGAEQGFILGMTAIVTTGPAAIGTIQKLVDAMKGGDATTAGAQFGATALGIGLVTVAADEFAKKTMGKGLFEFMFGGDQAAEESNAQLAHAAENIKAQGREAQTAQDKIDQLGEAQVRYNMALEKTTTQGFDHWKMMDQLSHTYDSQADSVQKLGADMLTMYAGGQASIEDYRTAQSWLSGDLLDVFNKASNADEVFKKYNQTQAEAAGVTRSLVDVLGAVEPTMASAGTSAGQAASYTDQYANALNSADDRGKALKTTLETLIGAFADTNPAVMEAGAENAFLQEELDDLLASTTPLTAAEQARVTVIQEMIAANNGLITSHQSNQTAMEGASAVMEKLMGEAGYRGLLRAMKEAGEGQEAQIEITKTVHSAFLDLANGALPQAMEKFDGLKAKLTPGEWREIAQAVGPELVAGVFKGVESGDWPKTMTFLDEIGRRMGFHTVHSTAVGVDENKGEITTSVDAGVSEAIVSGTATAESESPAIGSAIVSGMVSGIAGGFESIGNAARTAAQHAIDAAMAQLDSHSPSKVFVEVGKSIPQGLALGINLASGEAIGAVTDLTNKIKAYGTASDGPSITGIIGDAAFPTGNIGEAVGHGITDGIVDGIEAGTPDALQAMMTLIKSLTGSAQHDWLEGNPELAQQLIDAGYLTDIGNAAGANWVNGVITGVSSKIPEWVNTLTGFWQEVWSNTYAPTFGAPPPSVVATGGSASTGPAWQYPQTPGQPPIIGGVPVPGAGGSGGGTNTAGLTPTSDPHLFWNPATRDFVYVENPAHINSAVTGGQNGQPSMVAGVPVPGYKPPAAGSNLVPVGNGVFWDPDKRDYVSYPNIGPAGSTAAGQSGWDDTFRHPWTSGKDGDISGSSDYGQIRNNWAIDMSKIPGDATILQVDQDGTIVWNSPTAGFGSTPGAITTNWTDSGYRGTELTNPSAGGGPPGFVGTNAAGLNVWDYSRKMPSKGDGGIGYQQDGGTVAEWMVQQNAEKSNSWQQFLKDNGKVESQVKIGGSPVPGTELFGANYYDGVKKAFGLTDAEMLEYWDFIGHGFFGWGASYNPGYMDAIMSYGPQIGINLKSMLFANIDKSKRVKAESTRPGGYGGAAGGYGRPGVTGSGPGSRPGPWGGGGPPGPSDFGNSGGNVVVVNTMDANSFVTNARQINSALDDSRKRRIGSR